MMKLINVLRAFSAYAEIEKCPTILLFFCDAKTGHFRELQKRLSKK